MFCKNLLPSPGLQEFIRNYKILHLTFSNNHSIPYKHRPPKPEQGIVFYIKGNVELKNLANLTSQVPDPVSIFSHQTDKKRFHITADFLMFTIFLQPGVLHRLIGIPMEKLNQNYHDATLFFGPEIRIVNDQLAAAATDYASMVLIVEQFLLSQFKKLQTSNPIDDIANYLFADPTGFSLDAIAKQAYLSPKQFYRKFVLRIGLSPKYYSRITRFNHAYQFKIAHPGISWSAIAQQFSYTDYHHLEKECKEFTSLTPNEWLLENQAAPEKFLLPR